MNTRDPSFKFKPNDIRGEIDFFKQGYPFPRGKYCPFSGKPNNKLDALMDEHGFRHVELGTSRRPYVRPLGHGIAMMVYGLFSNEAPANMDDVIEVIIAPNNMFDDTMLAGFRFTSLASFLADNQWLKVSLKHKATVHIIRKKTRAPDVT